MEALITVACATKTSRKSLISPEGPTALRQRCQISTLGKTPGVPPKMHPGELCWAEPPPPRLTCTHTGAMGAKQRVQLCPRQGKWGSAAHRAQNLVTDKQGWPNCAGEISRSMDKKISPPLTLLATFHFNTCDTSIKCRASWQSGIIFRVASIVCLVTISSKVTSEEELYCCLYI